jgi:hypothetical protein
MDPRLRSLASVTAAAVVGTLLAVAPTSASAATVPSGRTLDYTCQQRLPGLPAGAAFDLPVGLDVLDTVTVPVGGTVGSISGALELDGLTGAVADLVHGLLGGAQQLTFTFAGTPYPAALSGSALTLPPLPAPSRPDRYALLAPQTFALSATVGCVLAGLDRVVTTVLVQAPPAGTGAGPVAAGPRPSVDPSRPNVCATLPARRPGQRVARLKARAERLAWYRRPAVRVSVTSRHRPAKGRVVACYGALEVGRARLVEGRVTLRTVRFHPGLYRLRVVYLGSRHAAARRTMIPLRAKR